MLQVLPKIQFWLTKVLLVMGLYLLLPMVSAHAATLYVAPTGADTNPGTITQPFRSLERAHGIAVGGDTIYMRGGRYAITSGISLTRSGTANNPIRIFAYPGEVPVIDAIGMTQTGYYSGWPLSLVNVSWNHVKGIEIVNGPMGGFAMTGTSNNNIIEGLNVHGSGRLSQWEGKGFIVLGNANNNLFLNNDSHNNRDIGDDDADGFAMQNTGTGNIMRGNRAWQNSDDGYDFFNIATANNVNGAEFILENNWAFENGYDDNLRATTGDGNGFKLGGRRPATSGNSSGGHMVQNNVSWGNRTAGFDENNANKQITFYNNTSYNNSGYNFIGWTVPHLLRNNISFGTSRGVSFLTGTDQSSNSWTLPVSVSSADFRSVDGSRAAGARQSDGSLPALDFMRLQTGSDLIDVGVNVNLPFSGTRPDLGAFELGAMAAPTPTPTPTPAPVFTSQYVAGSRVITSDTLTVRNSYGTAAASLGTQSIGALGTVGTQAAQSANGYTWIFVNFDSGVDGYVADAFVRTAPVAVTPTPLPAPTLVLNVNPSSVTAGSATTLSWSSINATTCTASGAWSGTRAINGTFTTSALTTTGTQTFNLTCTGTGGSVTQSASVSVTAPVVTPLPTPTPVTSGGQALSDDAILIGHSLVNTTMPVYVQAALNTQGGTGDVRYQVINGAPLRVNWTDSATAQGTDSRAAIATRDYEAVIMTEAIPLINHTTWNDSNGYAARFYNLAVTANPNTRVYLYETWHCLNTGTAAGCAYDDNDSQAWRPRLTSDLPRWEAIVNSVNAQRPTNARPMMIVPAGQAFARLHDEITAGRVPGITRIQDLFADDIHPNTLGTYFVAMVQYATIYGRTPVGLPAQLRTASGETLAGPSAALALKMQQVAWDTVSTYARSGVTGGGSTPTPVPTPTPAPAPAPAPTPVPAITFNVNPSSVVAGGTTNLTWSSTNATSCTASGAWSGTRSVNGTFTTSALTTTGTQTYTLTCTGAGGSVSRAAAVTVTAPMVTPTPTPVPTPTPTPIVTPFKINDRVSMTTNVNVRTTGLKTSATLIGVNPAGSGGTLIAGPTQSADGIIWFNVNFDIGFDGWVGADNYRLVIETVTPLPTLPVPPFFTTAVSGLTATAAFTLSNGCEGYTILWGDGTQSARAASPAGSPCTMAIVNVSQPHAYATAGTYTITVQRYSSGTTLKDTSSRIVTVTTPNVTPLPSPTPAPTLSLTANPSSVVSGGTTNLTWSSTNATSCTASGAWSGTRSVNGTFTTSALTTTGTQTYTLTCTGAGGSVSRAAAVTVTAPMVTPTPTPVPTPTPGAVLINGGFESQLSGWENWNNVMVVTAPVQSGSYALKLTNGEGGVGQRLINTLLPGDTYTLTFSAMKTGSEWLGVGADFKDANGKLLESKSTGVKSTSFSKGSHTFTVPANTREALIYVWKNAGSGYGYVDDITLTKNGVATPATYPVSDTWTKVADEGQSFAVTGTKLVRYGKNSTWIEKVVTGTIKCDNYFFGTDPLPNVIKECQESSATTFKTTSGTIVNPATSVSVPTGLRLVTALAPLRVRTNPSLAAAVIGTVPTNTRGEVENREVNADGYSWRLVQYGNGLYGWSVSNWLQEGM